MHQMAQLFLQPWPLLHLLHHHHHHHLLRLHILPSTTSTSASLSHLPFSSCSPWTEPKVINVGSSAAESISKKGSSSMSPVFAKLGSRSALYGDCEDYVLIEPGKDEVFVDLDELRARLRGWLENWPNSSLPDDLSRFNDLDAATTYLLESACELEICDGSGVVQWFEVRL